jgi:hypothetical protein
MRRKIQIALVLLCFFTADIYSQQIPGYAASSVLSSGKWIKVAITEDGIYRIDYSTLKQRGLEEPSNPRLFSNNTGQLSYYNNGTAPDDLNEAAIWLSKGADGVFNDGDYLLFFGKGTHRWIYDKSTDNYRFLRHNYSDTAFYFLTSGSEPGKMITEDAPPSGAPDYISSSSDALYIHESESQNLLQSGREWFEPFRSQVIKIEPGFTDLITSERIKYSIRVAARSSSQTQFGLYEDAIQKKNIIVQGVNLFNTTGTYAQITDSTGYIQSSSSAPAFQIRLNGQNSTGWLDYVKLQARQENVFKGTFTQYRDSRSVSAGRTTTFVIRSQSENEIVWDITDQNNVKLVNYSKSGNQLSFNSSGDSLRTFAVFLLSGAREPIIKQGFVPVQNLHASEAADMIIISHPLFLDYANMIADIHNNEGLVSLVVTPGQIYNEFSGGIPDIAALRNFVRMKYLKQSGSNKPLKYLLLFGDGSYENKTPPPGNPNFIPTYQSQNSNVTVSSFTSDDFYGLLEDGEGEADGTEDIGIGRFPVSDTTEASIAISKIRKYLDPSNMGNWRNIICLTADDEDGNAHMIDAEGLASTINQKAPEFNIEKIYLDAFRQVTTATGQSYPDVNRAINDRINSGCLVFNYTGHGSENGLASEGVVKIEDINSWRNGGRLPLLITATCEFSRFDNVAINIGTGEFTPQTSAGEMVFLKKEGGAIALMSTTRVVFSAPNFFLNRNIYNYAFERDSSGNTNTLGDIIRLAKNNSGNGSNKRNFSLLGDPALKLAFPRYGKVVTDSVNSVPAGMPTDSLKALSLITVAGHISDPKGVILNNFNGEVSPIIYDKDNNIRTLANDGGPVMEFKMRNNIIFSGKTKAVDGRFRFNFVVPRDINYSFGDGKISYYAHDDVSDMNGSFNDIIIGGFNNSSSTDTSGPDIRLFLNDTLFRNGGISDRNPVLLALIKDEAGINTTGAGIGHDLTGFLDNQRNSSFSLNNYYENDIDNYRKGRIEYNLTGLNEGKHTVTIKAWDIYNNSSERSLDFIVVSGDKFILRNVYNYPNPFIASSNSTNITGELNKPGNELEVTISIYNISGKLIKIIRTIVPATGYTMPPVVWDGNDDSGNRVAKGIYPYYVKVTTYDGETSGASGRMIIL